MHNHNKTRVVSVAFFVLIVVLIPLVSSQIKGAAIAGFSTPMVKNREAKLIEHYQKLLASGRVATEMKPSIEDKLEGAIMEATESARVVSAQEQTAIFSGKLTVIAELTLTPEIREIHKEKTKQPSELFMDPVTPFIKDAWFTTGWIDRSGEEEISYLAGVLFDDPEQAVIFICQGQCTGKRVSRHYLAEKNGALKITKAVDGKLIMLSKNGKEYRFNMKAKRFENAKGETLPDITTLPTLPGYLGP